MNFTASEASIVRTDVLKLGGVAVSAGLGLGFTQRFMAASLEVNPAADLAQFARRLERIGAPHVLDVPGLKRAPRIDARGDPVGAFLETVGRTVTGLLEQADIPVAGEPRVLAQEPPDGVSDRLYRRLALPALVPAAAAQALAWVAGLTNAWTEVPADEGIPAEQAELLKALKESLARQAPAGSNMRHLIRAAHAMNIPYMMLPLGVVQFGWGRRSRLMRSTETDRTPNCAATMCKNKLAATAMLRMAGLPVPGNESASTPEAALAAARRIGFPVVVKPVDQDGGKGAWPGIATEQALRAAHERARTFSPNIMVEQHVAGLEYRLLVVDGEVMSVHERVLGMLTGDGRSTVRQLIEASNTARRPGPHTGFHLIEIEETDALNELLAEQGLALDSIPGAGDTVRLQRTPRLLGGGTVRPVQDIIHPENMALAVRAARVMRLDIAGVDFLTSDITRPWHETGGAITEVNSQPQFSMIVRPDIASALLGRLVAGDGRIPVALVVGGETRELAGAVRAGLENAGIHAGVAGGGTITIGGALAGREGGLFQAAQMLLTDPAVDAVVLFTDGREIARDGLPFDRFDLLALAGGDTAPGTGDQVVALAAPHLSGEVLAAPQAQGADMARRVLGAARVRTMSGEMAGVLCSILAVRSAG